MLKLNLWFRQSRATLTLRFTATHAEILSYPKCRDGGHRSHNVADQLGDSRIIMIINAE